MGYGGKVAERERARELRAQSWTLVEIAAELGVAKSSVSLWVRDDLDLACSFWSELTAIPLPQFSKPYRAVADQSIRRSKHVMGCPAVVYASSRTHRSVMGIVAALLSTACLPG